MDQGGRLELALEKTIQIILEEKKSINIDDLFLELQNDCLRFTELNEFLSRIPSDRRKFFLNRMAGTIVCRMIEHLQINLSPVPKVSGEAPQTPKKSQ